ncbi:hypothetical protein F383_38241 [Gossypium arboreum]|uniref:Uncharacterized protein n=1 Tax=Gossypium arboreum TaxID=29729 RepID=A0A0B0MF91_GOSAR|nr:hypothetical protein F383_38241 [Gossypium arboreum]
MQNLKLECRLYKETWGITKEKISRIGVLESFKIWSNNLILSLNT